MWTWFCPTCGESGTIKDKPAFSRCYKCDYAGNYGPPLRIVSDVQKLVDHTHEMAIIRAIEVIEEEMAKTSPHTGHGKAQRSFGRRLLARFTNE